jgi:hypothetical protein
VGTIEEAGDELTPTSGKALPCSYLDAQTGPKPRSATPGTGHGKRSGVDINSVTGTGLLQGDQPRYRSSIPPPRALGTPIPGCCATIGVEYLPLSHEPQDHAKICSAPNTTGPEYVMEEVEVPRSCKHLRDPDQAPSAEQNIPSATSHV